MFGLLGDIIVWLLNQDVQSGLILLYLMNATNSAVWKWNCFLKSIKTEFPKLEMEFTRLWLGVPNSSPISFDLSSGPS